MLSSNWHVTLRLTVFETFAVKWPKFRRKISDLGARYSKGEKTCARPIRRCKHICAKFNADRWHRRCVSVTGQRKTATMQYTLQYSATLRMVGNNANKNAISEIQEYWICQSGCTLCPLVSANTSVPSLYDVALISNYELLYSFSCYCFVAVYRLACSKRIHCMALNAVPAAPAIGGVWLIVIGLPSVDIWVLKFH